MPVTKPAKQGAEPRLPPDPYDKRSRSEQGEIVDIAQTTGAPIRNGEWVPPGQPPHAPAAPLGSPRKHHDDVDILAFQTDGLLSSNRDDDEDD